MNWNSYFLCAILLLQNIQLAVNSPCKGRETRLKPIIRGKYQIVLNYNMGTLISSKQQNGFSGAIYGSCLRDNIYTITGGYGFTSSVIGKSIIFDLQEQYELDTCGTNPTSSIELKFIQYTMMQKQTYMRAILLKAQQLLHFLTRLFKNLKYTTLMERQINPTLNSYLKWWASYNKSRSLLQAPKKCVKLS